MLWCASDDEGLLVGVVGWPAVKLTMSTSLLVDGADGLSTWVKNGRQDYNEWLVSIRMLVLHGREREGRNVNEVLLSTWVGL